jgi:hypothetical protein
VPESVASKPSGVPSAYVPSPSSTTASARSALASARTAVCAWVIEQGAALEQVVPLPVGET